MPLIDRYSSERKGKSGKRGKIDSPAESHFHSVHYFISNKQFGISECLLGSERRGRFRTAAAAAELERIDDRKTIWKSLPAHVRQF